MSSSYMNGKEVTNIRTFAQDISVHDSGIIETFYFDKDADFDKILEVRKLIKIEGKNEN